MASLLEKVQRFVQEQGWQCRYDAEKQRFSLPIRFAVWEEPSLFRVDVQDQTVLFSVRYPFIFSAEHFAVVEKYIGLVQEIGALPGYFVLKEETGRVVYLMGMRVSESWDGLKEFTQKVFQIAGRYREIFAQLSEGKEPTGDAFEKLSVGETEMAVFVCALSAMEKEELKLLSNSLIREITTRRHGADAEIAADIVAGKRVSLPESYLARAGRMTDDQLDACYRLTVEERLYRTLGDTARIPADRMPCVDFSRIILESVAGPQAAAAAWSRLKELQEREK